MQFEAKKATRENIYVKLALMGPSGSGKTYSSLRLATGMLDVMRESGEIGNGKIVLANTEASRGKYYASEFEYDIVDLTAPYTPEMFVDLIDWAVKENYPILIIDTSSKEWEGKGGCLDIHQAAGGTYQAWGKVTPRHDKFIEKIADSPIHIVATMRGKDQYEINKDDDGRLGVKKLGVGAKQREGFEYEFTVTFLLDQSTNMADCKKDNTHLFEDDLEYQLSENHGRQLAEWANSGEGYTPPVRNRKTEQDMIKEIQQQVVDKAKGLGGRSNDALMNLLREYGSENPYKIKELAKLEELMEKLDLIASVEKISSDEDEE